MNKRILITGAVLAAIAVILGAFGAHGLKPLISEKGLATYETGVRYQMYHALAILITGILHQFFPNKKLRIANALFVAGIAIFSGSLYWLTCLEIAGVSGFRWIGAITPLGGVCMIAGWGLLATGIAAGATSLPPDGKA